MKRSKVVELIAAWGKPEILYDVYNNNYKQWADNLLYVLETEVGMRPPITTRLSSTGELFNKDKHFGRDVFYSSDTDSWYEED